MNNIEKKPFADIVSKLLFARYEQTKEKLIELENELRTVNRFFPDTIITRKIDTLIDAPHKVLKKGQIVYRCRLIDKFHEQDFFKGCYDDLLNKIREKIPNFGNKLGMYEYFKLMEYQQKNNMDNLFSDEELESFINKYSVKGWWGFDEKNSDAPPAGVTSAGRINPRGISYLYASNSKKTAALEVRPVITQYVSVAEIEITENVKLFDFTANYDDKEAEKHFEQSVDWSALSEYFSQPNYSGESAYLATQYISEYIKNLKGRTGNNVFDGLCFRSSLDCKGVNYVLFDTSENKKYKVNCSSLFQVKDLTGTLERYLPLALE